MNTAPETKRTWAAKFGDAIRGVRLGMSGQSSFLIHGVVAAAVFIAGVALRVSWTEWCLLALCIAGVLVAELFNSALESLAKAVDEQHNQALGAALDIASGAVLVAAIGAATVGVIVFAPHFWRLLIGQTWNEFPTSFRGSLRATAGDRQPCNTATQRGQPTNVKSDRRSIICLLGDQIALFFAEALSLARANR